MYKEVSEKIKPKLRNICEIQFNSILVTWKNKYIKVRQPMFVNIRVQ